MRTVTCNFCGSDRYEERRIDYLYSHQGKYLLVPKTPVEICRNCGGRMTLPRNPQGVANTCDGL